MKPETKLWAVRHAEQTSHFETSDPPLSPLGERQASAIADNLALEFADKTVDRFLCSPLLRTRQTASVIQKRIEGKSDQKCHLEVEPRVIELPSPQGLPLSERREFIIKSIRSTWSDVRSSKDMEHLLAWRENMLETILSLRGNALVVCHFMVINCLVSIATGSENLASFSPCHTSVTTFNVRDGKLELIKLGSEDSTRQLIGTN